MYARFFFLQEPALNLTCTQEEREEREKDESYHALVAAATPGACCGAQAH
jgi:hypothetical protein